MNESGMSDISTSSSSAPILLVTGAAGGLGRALIARVSAQSPNTQIVAVGRSQPRLDEIAERVSLSIEADVSTHEGAARALAVCTEKVGAPTLLAHCVGNIVLSPAARTTEAQYRDVMRANLDSAFFMLSAMTASLRAANSPGALCFVSTIAAQIGIANHEAVAAAKGGLEAMVRSAAATYASAGIRVNAVAPGLMETPAAAKFISTPTLRDASAKQYPLGTIGTADEIAEVMAWLLSDAARRVTGQIWTIDGGFTAIRPLVK
jgi:NAD(P)-dependent dehydrogenase (short-subunit alcohol dehydrogenase family)